MKEWMVTGWTVIALMLAVSGCASYEETENDLSIDTNYTSTSNNCNDDDYNTAGCYGSSEEFGDQKIVSGFWSLYQQRDEDIEYYETYLRGYIFESDGSVKKRNDTKSYLLGVSEWGVDEDGNTLTITAEETLTVQGRFNSNQDCFLVYSSETSGDLKLCHESFIASTLSNSDGYYGESVKFGNYDYGNYEVNGTWRFNESGTTVTMYADGTTSNGGTWGVMEDGKVLAADDTAYLVFKYYNNGCIYCFEMSGEYAVDQTTLCKE